MASDLVRVQVLLGKEQHAKLAAIAEREGKSLSAVLREAADERVRAGEREAVRERRRQALENLNRMRKEIQDRVGIIEGNPVEEARAEREAQWDEFLRQEARVCSRE